MRAVEAYRDLVLRTGEPSLGEIRQALQRLAEQERDDAAALWQRRSAAVRRAGDQVVFDTCLDEGHIVVRTGKGGQDRITVLPERSRQALVQQIEAVRRLHQEDLAQGFGTV